MAIFFSKELKLSNRLDALGVFDCILDEDSNYFINLRRLSVTKVPEFSESYEKINSYFSDIGLLLKASSSIGDKFFNTALKKFCFSEVNEINLGFSDTKRGAGFGKKLKKQIIKDAYEIIKKGSEYPELFHLLSLFEENVGPDRLSDMIATIIKQDIIAYTKRINAELNINAKNYSDYQFNEGILKNPYKNYDVLLLPVEILHELPIARCWDDIDRIVRENEAIKREINEMISNEWSKMASSAKKEYLREYVFMEPDKCNRVINAYRNSTVEPYDINRNSEYLIRRIAEELKKVNDDQISKDAYNSTLDILQIFKDWIENNKGYSVIQSASSKDREKIVQRVVHACALYYAITNGLDISPESNTGRGPVDFKISRGADKTVIELKLSSNDQCEHGFNIQIEEYAKSEQAKNKVFLLVDLGDKPQNIVKVMKADEYRKNRGESPATIFLVNAQNKASASNYKKQ